MTSYPRAVAYGTRVAFVAVVGYTLAAVWVGAMLAGGVIFDLEIRIRDWFSGSRDPR